jgi:hypothetical protein
VKGDDTLNHRDSTWEDRSLFDGPRGSTEGPGPVAYMIYAKIINRALLCIDFLSPK